MDENTPEKERSTPVWAYFVAALTGSLVGAVFDAVLYADGGSMLMKIGFVAGPLALYLARRGRTKDAP